MFPFRQKYKPALLVASTVAVVASGAAFNRPVQCQLVSKALSFGIMPHFMHENFLCFSFHAIHARIVVFFLLFWLASALSYAVQDSAIQAKAEDLKDHVQEFTEHVLEMAESPYDNKSATPSFSSAMSASFASGQDRGHGTGFFSSVGQHSDAEQHHSHGASTRQHHFGAPRDKMNKFRGAYVEEPLIPALFYVAVAGLTGSIIARKSK